MKRVEWTSQATSLTAYSACENALISIVSTKHPIVFNVYCSNCFHCTFRTVEPRIKVTGFTCIWKPGLANSVVTDGEIDEYSVFFNSMAVLSKEDDTHTDTASLSLIDELEGYWSCDYCLWINVSFISFASRLFQNI